MAATRWAVTGIEPITLAALRYGIAAVCLSPLALGAIRRLGSATDVANAICLSLLFFALFPYLFSLSLAHTTAARGSLALTTLPLLTYALSASLGQETFEPKRLIGIGLAMLGVAIGLSTRLDGGNALGDLLMLAAAAVGATYNVMARPLIRSVGALRFTAFGLAVGASALVGLNAQGPGTPSLDANQWLAVTYLGVVGCALTFALWSIGLRHAPPALVALTVTLNPVASGLIAAAFLGEPVTREMLAGLLFVVAGLAVASASPARCQRSNWRTRAWGRSASQKRPDSREQGSGSH